MSEKKRNTFNKSERNTYMDIEAEYINSLH